MSVKKNISKKEIYQKYIIEKLTLRETGDYFRVSPSTIKRNLKYHNIIIRNLSEGRKNKLLGKENPFYKTGEITSKQSGYIFKLIFPDNPFYSMTGKSNNYIQEHRLVMAKKLGRCLKKWEIVHHKNRNRSDNRIENLEIYNNKEHNSFHFENNLLKKELKKTIKEKEKIYKELLIMRQLLYI